MVSVGLAGALQGSGMLTTAGLTGALFVLLAGMVLLPVILDRMVRKPLASLATGMMTLTQDSAGQMIQMSRQSDAIGEVARASIAMLERHDHVEGMAGSLREAQGFSRDLHETAALLKQGQTQIAKGLVSTAEELEALRRTVSDGQADITNVYARAVREAERNAGAFEAVQQDLSTSGQMVINAVSALQRETSAVAGQRALMSAGIVAAASELNEVTRTLAVHVDMLGPQGHDVRSALLDIADRRASFVQTIEQATTAATRLNDVLSRVDERVSQAVGDTGSLKSAIEAMAPKLDEALSGVQMVGRALPEAAMLITGSLENIEAAVSEARSSVDVKLVALAANAATQAEYAGGLGEFQTAFETMRDDVGEMRQSFMPVIKDIQETLDRSVESLATLERVSVDIGSVQGSVAPMVDQVRHALDRTVETLASLERVTSDMKPASGGTAHANPLQVIQPEIDLAQKLLVGFRLIMRSLGEEVDTLRTKVAEIEAPQPSGTLFPTGLAPTGLDADLTGRLDQIEARLADIAAAISTHAAAAPTGASLAKYGEILPPTQDLGPEQLSFQRLLVGFRVLMRNISSESERLQSSVSRIAQDADGLAGVATPHTERLEQMLGAMGEMIAQLGERLRDVPVGTAARPATGTHVFDAQQAGFERVLVGFRLLMRDLGQEADKLRGVVSHANAASAGADTSGADTSGADTSGAVVIGRVDSQMQALNASFSTLLVDLETRLSSPLADAADNIGFAVAETLALLEQRLAEPIHQMVESARDCAQMLRDVKQSLAAQPVALASAQTPVPYQSSGSGSSAERLGEVTSRMDRWISQVDGTMAELTRNLSGSHDISDPELQEALDERIAQLGVLATQMRRETSEFVAVGAAISRDLEDHAEPEMQKKAATGGMGSLFGRRKK